MYLKKEKQGGPIPTGLKRWPLKLIKHLADTTCVSPSPACPTGCCPLNFIWVLYTLVDIAQRGAHKDAKHKKLLNLLCIVYIGHWPK